MAGLDGLDIEAPLAKAKSLARDSPKVAEIRRGVWV